MTEHTKAFIAAFDEFQKLQDKQTVTIVEDGKLRWEGGRFVVRGGIVKKMTYGIYRKLFRGNEC